MRREAAIMAFQSTPLMRGETLPSTPSSHQSGFQSTPLIRGETKKVLDRDPELDISIHSPHARGDCGREMLQIAGINFNPLPSCEGRR